MIMTAIVARQQFDQFFSPSSISTHKVSRNGFWRFLFLFQALNTLPSFTTFLHVSASVAVSAFFCFLSFGSDCIYIFSSYTFICDDDCPRAVYFFFFFFCPLVYMTSLHLMRHL